MDSAEQSCTVHSKGMQRPEVAANNLSPARVFCHLEETSDDFLAVSLMSANNKPDSWL